MIKLHNFLFALCIVLQSHTALAARSIGSTGVLTAFVTDEFFCSHQAKVQVKANELYYPSSGELEKIAVISGAVLGVECAELEKLQFDLELSETRVVTYEAEKSNSWALNPIEGSMSPESLLDADMRTLPTHNLSTKNSLAPKFRDSDFLITERGLVQLAAQNAGVKIFENEELSLHLVTNVRNTNPRRTGSAHCGTTSWTNSGKLQQSVGFGVIAIVKNTQKYNFSKAWLWYKLQPAVLSAYISSSLCPNASKIGVSVFIQGYDVTKTGHVYAVNEVEMPFLEAVPDQDNREWSGMLLDNRNFNVDSQYVISRGIVFSVFVLDKVNSPDCNENFLDSKYSIANENCTFEKFNPIYEAYRVARIDQPKDQEINGSFEFLVQQKKERYLREQQFRKAELERAGTWTAPN